MEIANLASPSPHTLEFSWRRVRRPDNFAEMQKQGQAKAPSHCSETQCLPKLELTSKRKGGSDDP